MELLGFGELENHLSCDLFILLDSLLVGELLDFVVD